MKSSSGTKRNIARRIAEQFGEDVVVEKTYKSRVSGRTEIGFVSQSKLIRWDAWVMCSIFEQNQNTLTI